ncbi:Ubiquitin fusion degradation protein 4 [Taxawa tesnikishii (nom. ined.)]|nr:Ubiquitin fusion degradation protein 4 [Dothideales sp. JES 119]
MSPRVTRSSARLAADISTNDTNLPRTNTDPPPPTRTQATSKKRKAPAPEPSSTDLAEQLPTRRTKRTKATETEAQPAPQPPDSARTKRGKKATTTAMSSAGHDEGDVGRHASGNRRRQSSGTSEETSPHNGGSRRRSSRKKGNQGKTVQAQPTNAGLGSQAPASNSTPSASTSKRSKKGSSRKELESSAGNTQLRGGAEEEHDSDEGDDNQHDEEDREEEESAQTGPNRGNYDDDDPFTNALLGRGGPSGLSSTLRALSGMISGMGSRLRRLLEQLRSDDSTVQMVALSELSEILLVSNEDNLAGHFSPDPYVKELIKLMQPNDFTGEENPEMMLLACRCIANLMEALPTSTSSIVYGGAVPVLCQKLLEIHYIDLAEQALITLEKISVEFPSSIVREGGLTACLTYLDFFATSTQRTAVTTAANCCRSIPEDSFPVVRDVMPVLLGVLQNGNDQKVVEQGSLCVARIVDSFKFYEGKLEELVSAELLQAILRLLLPGSTNMIGPSIHTQFLRVLAITARTSPRLSAELLRMNVVDTLYQILTGVSPPTGVEDAALKIDKNVIMQALIRTPRDQVFETLNVICEMLPNVYRDNLMFLDDLNDAGYTGSSPVSMSTRSRKSPNDKRLELLEDCKDEVKRFAVILFPTLMHAYTSTVNFQVREKVLTAQLKMLSNFDTAVIEAALEGVTYASHLASILSQQDNPTLVTYALQIAELLLKRLEHVYRPQFYREGVMAEIANHSSGTYGYLAPPSAEEPAEEVVPHEEGDNEDRDENDDEPDYPNEEDHGSDDDDHNDNHDDQDDEDGSEDDDSDAGPRRRRPDVPTDILDIITARAKKFMAAHENEGNPDMRAAALKNLSDLQALAQELRNCYTRDSGKNGRELFKRLAEHFNGNALEGVTSYELLTSGTVDVLLELFAGSGMFANADARTAFLEAFMSSSSQVKIATGSTSSPATAFTVLVHKLQDLLSRSEHFEVITVHQNAFDSNRSSAASMLAKQLRLKLSADEDSGIPRAYRNIMVSIHAIATFRALDDYLRPRISLAERPRVRSHDSFHRAMSAAMGGRGDAETGGPSLPPTAPETSSPAPSRSASSTKVAKPSTPGGSKAEGASRLRRSSRKVSTQQNRTDKEDLPSALTNPGDADQNPVECADEAPLSDDEEDTEAALDAIVNDLEEEMDQDDDDPSAVNMEVANTGKVTARREDGTRVATPLQGSQASQASQSSSAARLAALARLEAAREMLSTPTSQSRPMSYASALQAVSQDWHIEFSVNGQPLANDTTIYRAVHFNQANPEEVSSRNIWSALHKITFKRVPGPPPSEGSSLTPPPEAHPATTSGLPLSLNQHPVTASILRLMSILHGMNANLDDVLATNKGGMKLNAEPLSQFVNTKLTAKLNRQLEEPLIVASNCLPSWSEDLARLYPFLFPFETRHLFLQSTSFGYSRSMTRWQNSQPENDTRGRHRDERPFLGRLQRQKVRISRQRILESALKVMQLYGSSPSVLEVEFFEEVGTGLGPTLEFYSDVSKEFSRKKIKLWRENESSPNDEFAFGARGLFPAPMSEQQANNENGKRVLHLFRMLGKFVARSMLDSRIIDISFNPTFFRIGDSDATVTPSLGAVAAVDKDLANSLKDLVQAAKAKSEIDSDPRLTPEQKVQAVDQIDIRGASVSDLGLDFTLPGYSSIELQPNGSHMDVTIDNVGLYVEKVIDFTLGSGVQRQVEAFKTGFSQVFPYSALRAFTPDELVMLFGRADEDWSLETLMDSIKADHGYNLDSPSVRNLLQTMSQLDAAQRRDFLQFVSGSPKLPIGGFKALTPMFTVVCKPAEPPYTSDDYLPSVMTCVNYLKMPDYSSLEVLKEKLILATTMGQGAFHLS